ncbi:MAG: SAF domain-containing protein [Moorellales bacterium]
MTRKAGIAVSLILALLFTFLIVRAAGQTEEQKVRVARTKDFVAAGEVLTAEKLEAVELPRSAAEGAAAVEEASGKPVKVSLVKGQLVYREALDQGAALRKGYVEVFVPVDLASSAMVLPGQVVNVYAVAKQQGEAPTLLLEKVRVLHSVASQGEAVGSSKQGVAAAVQASNVPAAVGLEIPADRAALVAQAAAQKAVYLARVAP